MWLAKVILVVVCFSNVKNQKLNSHAIYLEDDLVSSNLIPVLRNDEEEAETDAIDSEKEVTKYGIRVAAKAVAAIAKIKMEPEEERESRNAQNLNSSMEMYGDDPLYLEYGVHSERLYQPLLVGEEKALHYGVLVSTPHGRHLLLVSLLEQLSGTSWSDRCGGKLKIYLPKSLRSPDQPEAPYGACLLANIVEEGVVVNREMVMQKFNKIVKQDEDFEIFSWFTAHHRDVVHKLAEWVLSAESFGSSYSLLVTIRDRLSKQIFVELVNLVIAGREDTGFVTPSMETYMPEAFFDQDVLAPGYGCGGEADDGSDVEQFGYLPVVNQVWENTGRDGKNWEWRGNRWVWEEDYDDYDDYYDDDYYDDYYDDDDYDDAVPASPPQQQQSSQPWGVSGMTWTRNNVQEAEWYFREDPVANAHHSEWHRGGTGPRRGEYFYYMHGQMLARYEGERLSLGLGLTTPFGPEQWDRRVGDSYDPRLGTAWSRRNPGFINAWVMHGMVGTINNLARSTGPYTQGVDRGIDRFGAAFERDLHNTGHVQISGLSPGGRGVMGSTVGAMRDPIFYRWHGYVHSKFTEYKNNLNRVSPYSDADLGFSGVQVGSVTVQSEGGAPDTFYTYREMASVMLNSLDSNSPGNRMSVQYMRLNHRPFTWHITINSDRPTRTPAIVRVFMMPARGVGNRATIHMDHFYVDLDPGINTVTRDELEAPHLSKSRWSLSQLQDNLMNGQVNRRDFSWGGCGWPRHLNVPRGTEGGMEWHLVVMVSRVLPQDMSRLGEWRRNSNLAWSYCGVNRGNAPDSRPMGFPVDRVRDFGDIVNMAIGRENWGLTGVTIMHGSS